MSHFGLEQWADFARRNLPAHQETSMQEHLESGCSRCVEALQVWLGVLEVATSLNVFTPPEGGVGFLRALYRAFPPGPSRHVNVSRLVLPAFADADGVRTASAAGRHFMFQRDNVLLDVHVEQSPESAALSMAGQIQDPVSPNPRFSGRRVSLLTEEAELGQTYTNSFGEFQIEFAPAGDLMLVIHLEAEALLVTPLPSFALAATLPGSGLERLMENPDTSN